MYSRSAESGIPIQIFDVAIQFLFSQGDSGSTFHTKYDGVDIEFRCSQSAQIADILPAWDAVKRAVMMTRSNEKIELPDISREAAEALVSISVEMRSTGNGVAVWGCRFGVIDSCITHGESQFAIPSREFVRQLLAGN
jgi:hypothetical protein